MGIVVYQGGILAVSHRGVPVMGRKHLISSLVLSFMFLVSACGEEGVITAYPLGKANPTTGHEWITWNPTTYRVGKDRVIGKTLGELTDYRICKVLTTEDWECTYKDRSGNFGFRNGDYWEEPKSGNYVSRFRYNLVRCEWAINDKYEGFFGGAVRCVFGWV